MNYKLINNKEFDFYDVNIKHYKHLSGIEIVFLKNNDSNLAFVANIKTIPENNKGIPHVLEHLILNGSKNYKVKDTFNELLKTSFQDYLNAMTYLDKTVYPLATTNENEFIKMIDVYLDGIFNPLLREGAFMQEGVCFYEEQGEIYPNGIVYNEMLYLENDYIEQNKQKNYEILFENSYFKYNSAGIPNCLINLEYEEVLDYYKRTYKSYNKIIFLYGDLNEDKYLDYLHEKYLKHEKEYSILSEKNLLFNDNLPIIKKNYSKNKVESVMISFIAGKTINIKELLLSQIIFEYLKNNLEDVKIEIDKDNYFIVFNFYMDEKQISTSGFYKLLVNKINNININMLEISTLISKIELVIIEEDYGYKTKGIGLIFLLINNFLYQENFFEPMYNYQILQEIKNELTKTYLEKQILNMFICNEKYVATSINEKTNIYQTNLSYDKKINLTSLVEYQNQIDSKNQLSKFKSNNIRKVLKEYKNKIGRNNFINSTNLMNFNIKNKKVFYIKINIQTNNIKKDKLQYIGILTWFLNNIKLTNNDSFISDIHESIIEFNFDNHVYLNKYDNKSYEFLTLTIKGNIKSIDKLNYILSYIFSDKVIQEKKQTSCIINKVKQDNEKRLKSDNYSFTKNRTQNLFYKEFSRLDKIKYYDFYKSVIKLEENHKENYIYKELENLHKQIFTLDNCDVVICTSNDNKEKIAKIMKQFFIKQNVNNNLIIQKICNSNDEVIGYNKTNFSNSMVMKQNNLSTEELLFISKIIENEYIYENIRLKGGAYGYGCHVINGNDLIIYSFKDPNIEKTKEVFLNAISHIKKCPLDQEKLEMLKISVVNDIIKTKHDYKTFDEFLKRRYENTRIDVDKVIQMNLKQLKCCISRLSIEEYGFTSF